MDYCRQRQGRRANGNFLSQETEIMPEKVVITGMGTINPLGFSVKESWENATKSKSVVGPITHFDPSAFQVRIACEVKGFDPEMYLPAKEVRRRDRFEQFAFVATQEAVRQAGFEPDPGLSHRVGVIISCAIGGVKAFQDNVMTMLREGARRVNPFVIPMLM